MPHPHTLTHTHMSPVSFIMNITTTVITIMNFNCIKSIPSFAVLAAESWSTCSSAFFIISWCHCVHVCGLVHVLVYSDLCCWNCVSAKGCPIIIFMGCCMLSDQEAVKCYTWWLWDGWAVFRALADEGMLFAGGSGSVDHHSTIHGWSARTQVPYCHGRDKSELSVLTITVCWISFTTSQSQLFLFWIYNSQFVSLG